MRAVVRAVVRAGVRAGGRAGGRAGARRPALALGVLLLLTACGVPEDDEPRALDRAAAPFRVFEGDVAPEPQGDVEVQLYFVRTDRVVPVPRTVQSPGSPQQVLTTLFAGLTEEERATGLTSAITAAVISFEGVEVRDRIAVVTLEGFNEQTQVSVFAQIVATLVGRPGIEGVRFRSGGQDVRVPRGDTSLTEAAVDLQAYAELLGLPADGSPVPPAPVTPAPGGPAPAPDE